ncbi:J domain-containing protein [Paraburkholderia bannensis]|uniref:J domain-containing protein n=1 Tax=Paraburkholderia bannensis TaxID=765414 RepID=UPI002AB77DFF|nr:J domain-containing protein [Paraburkholderia bannensis]
MTTAYPLQWPDGRSRTPSYKRAPASFSTTFAGARDNLIAEVRRLGGRHLVISTNVPLRQDGLPYARYATLDDEGVAVYFTLDGRQMCFACDRWNKVEHNMHAIVKTIDALRGIARWGTGDMMAAAFTGFSALPAPGASRTWREVLGLHSGERNMDIVRAAYRRLAQKHHPDRPGGSHDAMTDLNAALATAEKELKE